MGLASISHEDRLLPHFMTSSPICCTHVDTVPVIGAPADRITFNDEITHDGEVGSRMCFEDCMAG